MDLSKFLGKVIGTYLVIVSLVMFVNMPQFMSNVSSLVNNPSLMFVTGFFTLVLGLLMVVSHNIWQWHWRIIITIISWIALLKGASILFYPQFIDKTSILLTQNTTAAYFAAGLDLLLGLLLCYFGFKR